MVANIVLLLLDRGADIDSKDKVYGQTPLLWAAEDGHEAVVRQLLDRGAAMQAMNNIKRTPLSCAVRNGHDRVLLMLLANDNNPDSKDHYGSTSLSIAARHGHIEVLSLLLETGSVDIDSQDCFGRTPLWYATRHGHSDIAQLLHDNAGKSGVSLCEGDLPLEVGSRSADATSRWCDVCTLDIQKDDDYYECQICNGGDFDVCLECYKSGGRCLEVDHECVVKQGI